MQFDVPVNDSAIHVTNIKSPLPPFFALSTDNKYSLNLKTEDLASCSGAPVRTCRLLTGTRRTDTPDCAMALFTNTQVLDKCEFNLVERPLPSFLLEISADLAIISNTNEVIETCLNEQETRKLAGCKFCSLDIKCGCTYTTPNYRSRPRLDDCSNLATTTLTHYLNQAVLESFFDPSEIQKFVNQEQEGEPLQVKLPDLKIEDRAFKLHADADKKLSISLKHAVSAMKRGKPVFGQFPDVELEELVDTDPTGQIVTYVTLGLTIFNALAIFAVHRRLPS